MSIVFLLNLLSYITSKLSQPKCSDLQKTFRIQQVLNIATLYIFVLITPYANGIYFCVNRIAFDHQWPLWLCHFFFFVITLSVAWFSEKMCVMWNVCFNFLYTLFLKLFLFQEEFCKVLSWTYLIYHVNCLIVLSGVNQILIISTDFNRSPQYKFHRNPSSGSQVVSCRRADGQTYRYDEAN
jgi:hypothetical protein